MPSKKNTSRKPTKPTAQSSTEKLKQFIRTRGADYLLDKNITSVGIGYKQEGGKPTKELAIQFTVDRKLSPERLELLGTEEIPRSIVVDGVEYPTDVIERSYSKAFKIVAEVAAGDRKTRIEPI